MIITIYHKYSTEKALIKMVFLYYFDGEILDIVTVVRMYLVSSFLKATVLKRVSYCRLFIKEASKMSFLLCNTFLLTIPHVEIIAKCRELGIGSLSTLGFLSVTVKIRNRWQARKRSVI